MQTCADRAGQQPRCTQPLGAHHSPDHLWPSPVARVGQCPPLPAPLVCANHRSTKEHHTPINPHTWLLKKNIAGLAICPLPPSHVSHFCDQSSGACQRTSPFLDCGSRTSLRSARYNTLSRWKAKCNKEQQKTQKMPDAKKQTSTNGHSPNCCT